MPLIKHNKNNERERANDLPGNVQGVNTVGNHDQMNMPQNQLPPGVDHHHGLDPATRPFGVHDSAALNAPGATTNVDGVTIPAAGATKKNSSGAGEKAFLGKLEHAAGTILCSSTLRAKGIQKEKEAQALKVQAAELNAAEHLEAEARLRRERAVAHGADPQILQQGPHADRSTAVDSGAPNIAGIGAGPGPGNQGGIPQANLNAAHVPQTHTGVGGGGAPQGMAGQQMGTTAGMAPQGMMGGAAPQQTIMDGGAPQGMAGQQMGTTAEMAPQGMMAPQQTSTHMIPQGAQGNQPFSQGQIPPGMSSYPPQRQDNIGESAYTTHGVGVH